MKILDRYIAKNFLIGYVIAFCVLIGLRVIIDLFVHLDEFTEHAELETMDVMKNMLTFYALNCTLYFREFAGMITVVAASFSFSRMVRSNELIAIMASGVSLKRVIGPIVLLAMLFTGALVVDQEFIIPALADELVRAHDDIPGRESYNIKFIPDSNGSLIFSGRFHTATSTLYNPTIITRRMTENSWEVTGRIDAEKAIHNEQTKKWDLINGRFLEKGSTKGVRPIAFYESDITPNDIPIRLKSEHKTLLSWRQLAVLVKQAQEGKIRDSSELYSQKHFRVTEPIINLVMLMVCLPILVCRDPKTVKTAVSKSFAVVGGCFIATFICKMIAIEADISNFYQIGFYAWLPIFIFLPIAFILFDSMKT
ncbi:MAG: LptF/LptG family permease [Sedimentisphaerales bacterium]|nr:LptF/LptG family permease [Sedimentisphaerales bacterium]